MKQEPILTIYKSEKWGFYYAVDSDFVSLEQSPVARLSPESIERMLDRIETAGFSFGVESIEILSDELS